MAGFNISTSGFAALEARLQNLSKDVATKAGQSANRAGAVYMAKKIKEAAPVGPDAEGSTRTRTRKGGKKVTEKHHKIVNHIKVKKGKPPRDGSVENLITVGNAYQASFVEFGSIHNAPDPFMSRTFAAEQDAAIEVVKKTLGKRLTKKGV